MTCTAVNTGTSPVTAPIAFNYSSVNGNFYGAAQWINIKGVPVDACETPSFALPIKVLAAQYVTSQSLGNGNVWNGFVKAGTGTTDVPIPSATISYPITVTPSTDSSSPQCAPSTTTPTNPTGTCTGPSCLPSAPDITSAGSQTCTLNTAFTNQLHRNGSTESGDPVSDQLEWRRDGQSGRS